MWPKAQEFGFPNEEAAFALQYGHGIGLAIWEKPVISRLVSLEHPVTSSSPAWCSRSKLSGLRPTAGARRASKKKSWSRRPGHEVITRFPAEELLVAGAHYFTVNGPLPTTRETEAAPSARCCEMIEASAKTERVGVSD